jgi:nucleotide-binding universal stress UspA family protein
MKRMLVALDHPPRAGAVLAFAVEEARAHGASLIAYHAVSVPVGLPPEAYAITPEELPELLLREARAQLDQLVRERVPPTVAVELRVELGVAWRRICEVAQEADVERIVIGSHGYGGIDRLLGTTAARVVNHADRTVLVVRATGRD